MYINTQVKIISRSNRNTYVGYIFSEWRLCDTLLTDLLYDNRVVVLVGMLIIMEKKEG